MSPLCSPLSEFATVPLSPASLGCTTEIQGVWHPSEGTLQVYLPGPPAIWWAGLRELFPLGAASGEAGVICVNTSDRSQGPPWGTEPPLRLLIGSDRSWEPRHHLGADSHPSSWHCRHPDTRLAVEGGRERGERTSWGRDHPAAPCSRCGASVCGFLTCERASVLSISKGVLS